MWFLRILLICLCFVAGHHAARADNNTSIANGATTDLSLYSGCKTFLNTCGAAIMVPTAYQVTWDAIPYGFGTNQCAQQLPCYTGEPSGVNVALATSGATALASQTYHPDFAASRVIDGLRYFRSSWLEVNFATVETINTVNLIGLQDAAPVAPTLAMTFSVSGMVDFNLQYWTGTAWVNLPGGVVTGNNKVWYQLTFPDVTTNKIRVLVDGALGGAARIVEFEALRSSDAVNVALATNGGTVIPGNTRFGFDPAFSSARAIDGDRVGTSGHWYGEGGDGVAWYSNYKSGGYWTASTTASAQWVQVNFASSYSINRILVSFDHDSSALPTSKLTTANVCNNECVRDFVVQYWTGAAWQDISETSFTGNNRSIRDIAFSSVTTNRIRVYMTRAAVTGGYKIAQIKAYRASDGVDVAAASTGSTVSASTTYHSDFAASYTTDSVDYHPSSWIEVRFNATRTINEIDVFTQGSSGTNSVNLSRPTITSQATSNYIKDYEIQFWNGVTWQTIPGGVVSNNILLRRQFKFSNITTTSIRVIVFATNDGGVRITEIEAWTP